MDIILKGLSIDDLQYLRGSLECRRFKVRSALSKVNSDSKMNSDADAKEYYASCVADLEEELNSLNGLLDML